MTEATEEPTANGAEPKEMPLSIESEPCAGQTIYHKGSTFTTIKEGLAHILVPADAPTTLDTKKHQQAQKQKTRSDLPAQSVFYNPIQQFNRDLSVLAIKAYSEHVTAVRDEKVRQGAERRAKRPKRGKKFDGNARSAQSEDQGSSVVTVENGISAVANEDRTDVTGNDVGKEDKAISNGNGQDNKDGGDPEQVDSLASVLKRKAGDDADLSDHENGALKRQRTTLELQPDLEASETGRLDATDVKSIDRGYDDSKTAPAPLAGPFRILDALSATGLRALRYAKEVPAVTLITANDISSEATDSIKANVEHNRLSKKVQVNTANAMSYLYQFVDNAKSKYDVIDLDPYGTAVPFLDSAIQALNDGGLLCVTCTDAGVWASHGYSEKTFSLYGGNPLKGFHSHEGGLRLILNAIATSAARYGIAIEPLMSLSIDFYARVFVRIKRSPEHVKHLAGKTMLVYNCDSGCGAWKTQFIGRNIASTARNGQTVFKHGLAQGPSCSPFCEHCGFKMHLAGPMWGGPLHNPRFLERLLASPTDLDKNVYGTAARIEGMLTTALEETIVEQYGHFDEASTLGPQQDERLIPTMLPHIADQHAFFFMPQALAGIVHCQAPNETALKGALRHAGYRASRSHCQPGSIRTNAPWDFIWNTMREWVRQKAPLKEGALKSGTAGYTIMQQANNEQEHTNGENQDSNKAQQTIVFDEVLGREKVKRRLVRYQANPRENWGPMNKAKR